MPVDLPAPRLRRLGLQDYQNVWQQMQDFTAQRDATTRDELWLLQHHPVFTQGQAGKAEHVLNAGEIPVVQSDRGGQVTYHGPGQLGGYVLLDVRRRGFGVRSLVDIIESAIIEVLAGYGIAAELRKGAPGVYVGDSKIAALGLRIRRGCSLHGLAFNIDMDLEPFSRINPCGYAGMAVTQLSELLERHDSTLFTEAETRVVEALLARLL